MTNRIGYLTTVCMLIGVIVLWQGVVVASGVGDAKLPNILFIVSDDQGWSDYGFMGHKQIETPRLDALSRESRTFRYGYVPTSLCRPSLATILSGLYPHEHFITGNEPPRGPDSNRDALRKEMIAKIDQVALLPKTLGGLGYRSLQTGKWWEGDFRRGGFTDGMTHGDPSRRGRHGDAGLQIGRQGIEPIRKFLDDNGGQPWLIWYAPMMPHLSHNPPQKLKEKYRTHTESPHMADYWGMCEWFDQTCGEVLDELDRRNLTENTLVVFIADNGYIQDPEKGDRAARSKLSPYEGGVRTPIMLRWPGHISPKTIDTPVSSIDLAPTILTAVGLSPIAEMSGVNLLDDSVVSARKAIFGEIFHHDSADLNRPSASLEYRWCVAAPWKLIIPAPGKGADSKPELFQIVDDPSEQTDESTNHPDVVKRLQNLTNAWWNATP